MKKTIFLGLTALFAWPMTMSASVPNCVLDDDVPLVIHAPHRAPRHVPLVYVEFDAGSRTVEITFNQSLANVSIMIEKNGVSLMEYSLGDILGGSRYEACIDAVNSTEEMMLYVVSNGTIISVNSLD